MTPTGKVIKSELVRRYISELGRPGSPARMTLPLAMPRSRAEIHAIQTERKRRAFELAKQTAWYKGKLDHIDPAKLDEPSEWEKIPILDKDTLRRFSHAEFLEQLSIAPPTPNRRILALRRLDRPASLLSTHV